MTFEQCVRWYELIPSKENISDKQSAHAQRIATITGLGPYARILAAIYKEVKPEILTQGQIQNYLCFHHEYDAVDIAAIVREYQKHV